MLLDDKFDKNSTYQYGNWGSCRCENVNCATVSESATRITLNGATAIGATFGEKSVPLYICESCYQDADTDWTPYLNIFKPLIKIGLDCEKGNCAHDEEAEVTLFIKSKAPIYRLPKMRRYCRTCYNSLTPDESAQFVAQSGPDAIAWSLLFFWF